MFGNKQAFGPFYALSIRQTHSLRLYATSCLSAVVFVHRPSKAIMPSYIAKRFQGSHASWLPWICCDSLVGRCTSWSKPVRHEEPGRQPDIHFDKFEVGVMFNIHSGHIALAVLLTSYIATLAETAKIHCLSFSLDCAILLSAFYADKTESTCCVETVNATTLLPAIFVGRGLFFIATSYQSYHYPQRFTNLHFLMKRLVAFTIWKRPTREKAGSRDAMIMHLFLVAFYSFI